MDRGLTPTPVGRRVLVTPDPVATETASGFLIPSAQHQPKMSGRVAAVGTGSAREWRIRCATIARCRSILEHAEVETVTAEDALRVAREELARYLRHAEDLGHPFAVGDRVAFAAESGHELVLDEATNDAVIVLDEDDVLAVLMPTEPVVERTR